MVTPKTVELDVPAEVAVMDTRGKKGAIRGRGRENSYQSSRWTPKIRGELGQPRLTTSNLNYGRRPDILSKVWLKPSQMSCGDSSGIIGDVWNKDAFIGQHLPYTQGMGIAKVPLRDRIMLILFAPEGLAPRKSDPATANSGTTKA